jgi:hypothetical protein
MTDLILDQAIYGSRSGEADFQILGASAGLTREERDAFLHASNLGGSAQTAADPSPIYAFYPMDPAARRWGFSRTAFLGRGGRGNDYLAHLVVLHVEALHALRGDVFLLEDLNVFRADKPEREHPPPLVLDLERVEQAARRPLGTRGADPERLTPLLRGLARGSVAIEVPTGQEGADLCRSLVACLPPDDRSRMSFCSRFSLPRGMAFRFAAYRPADRGLAVRHLAGFATTVSPTGTTADEFSAWLGLVADGAEPLAGLSVLERPAEAVTRFSLLSRLTRGEAPASEGLDPGLLPLLLDVRNRPFEVRRLLAGAVFAELHRHIVEAIQSRASLAQVFRACTALRERESTDGLVEEVVGIATRVRRPGFVERTAGVVAALLLASPARLALLFGGRSSLLATPAAAGTWISELEEASPAAALELLACWFTHWRLAAGRRCMSGVLTILPSLSGPGAIRAVLGALEAAAPPAGDAERAGWFITLLREARPRAGALFPPLHAARLAAQEGLLGELTARERADLVPALAAELPEMASELLSDGPIDYGLLSDLVEVCQRGLLGRTMEGDGWDVEVRPALWDLAARVAQTAVTEASRRNDVHLLCEVAWLVWGASRLVAGGGRISWPAVPLADPRFAEAVQQLLVAAPAGASDIVVRAVYRLGRSGGGLPLVAPDRYAHFRRQAWRDAHRQSPHPGFRLGTLVRIAWLDRQLSREVALHP